MVPIVGSADSDGTSPAVELRRFKMSRGALTVMTSEKHLRAHHGEVAVKATHGYGQTGEVQAF